jgi:DNA polymerase
MSVESKQKAIDKLNAAMKGCTRCRLCRTRKNVLGGEGNLQARLMLLAQAPGENEDREGKMFIGPSGQVLDDLLEEAGIGRDEIYMTNLIKCKLPQNRKPKQDEIATCSRFLEQEIVLIDPEIIVPLGYYATRYILSRYKLPIPQTRAEFSSCYGRLFLSQNQKIFPLPHPASLLYNQSLKPMTVEQYRRLKVISQDELKCSIISKFG